MLVCVLSRFSRVWLIATLWTVACQAPLSMGFSREEYWSRLPCPPPGDLSHPGTRTIGYTPIQNKVKKKKKGIFFFCRVSCILNFSDARRNILGLPRWLSDVDLIAGSGRSPGEGQGNPLQYSFLENPMDRGAWQAAVYRVSQSQTQLKQLRVHAS